MAVRRHTAEHRSIDVSHCRLSPTGNSCAHACSPPPPVPSIKAQRLRASWRNPVLPDPRTDFDVRTFAAGCFGRRKTRERNRSRCEKLARVFMCSLCGRRKRNAPGWESEGVRVPRRSGRPISAGKINRVGDRCRAAGALAAIRSHARTSWHRVAGARFWAIWRRKGRSSWRRSRDDGFENSQRSAEGAHVTPALYEMQTFFAALIVPTVGIAIAYGRVWSCLNRRFIPVHCADRGNS
jgi:hypothetical protein